MLNKVNGGEKRLCDSWINRFIQFTDNLESAEVFRRWTAISVIAATLQQKVFMNTGSYLYPNIYVWLIGKAGIGKTRAIGAAGKLIRPVEGMHFGATSMTSASLVDHLNEAKCKVIRFPNEMLEYNALYIIADELSAFMSKWDTEMAASLTQFFDNEPYAQGRRVANIRIKIAKPQLNMLVGSTPANLMGLVPDIAWEQGLMSRVFLVHSHERPIINIFDTTNVNRSIPKELEHDLKIIARLEGQFGWTEEWAEAMHNWKEMEHSIPDVAPKPDHPRLASYVSRRFSHAMKLAMISAIDRGNELILTLPDFNRSIGWLAEIEAAMPDIFAEGALSPEAKAQEDIIHFVRQHGDKGVLESRLLNFARERLPGREVRAAVELLEKAGTIYSSAYDTKTGLRTFIVRR